MFATVEEVKSLLSTGKSLVLAGDEKLLSALPAGRWIGGTIPYFMTASGGQTSRDRIFVQTVPAVAKSCHISVYDANSIARIGEDSPDRGYTILIVPAFTPLHQQYALNAPSYRDLFLKVVAGWVSGVHLDDLGKRAPRVFDGNTGIALADRAVAMHVELPAPQRAHLEIVNIFEPGDGDEIRFPTTGFQAADCTVNGERRNFREYFLARKLDSRLPLVADLYGTKVNVSIQVLEAASGLVRFYAPVFADVPYKLARPVGSYPQRFISAIPEQKLEPAFSCNCVLNYVYGELEGRQAGQLLGPMTFGEIAFQLLNQTLVYVTIGATG